MKKPIWTNLRHDLGDGKYIGETVQNGGDGREHPPFFPAYIDNKEHPFTFNESLSYRDNKNNTLYTFSGTDSPQKFEEHKKTQPASWKYHTKEIVYKVNSSGYRTYEWDDIDWANAIVMLGCSCTFGVGVAEDETITHLLEQISGCQVVNLGYPGGSNQLMLNNLSTLINKFPAPRAVVMSWTSGNRFRHFFKHRYLEIGPWHAANSNIKVDSVVDGVDLANLWINRYYDRYNEVCESYYIAQAAKAICKDKIQYISGSHFDYIAYATRSDTEFSSTRTARDLLHPGIEDFQPAAKFINEQL
jgi:hypothetical protein